MIPNFETLKRELMEEWEKRLPHFFSRGSDFKLKYKFHRGWTGNWFVRLCASWDGKTWEDVKLAATCWDFEGALRETYRLNGWGEPKNIRPRY